MNHPTEILQTVLFWWLVAGIPLSLVVWAFKRRWFAKHGDQEEYHEARESFRFRK